jgi:hypothetical protein
MRRLWPMIRSAIRENNQRIKKQQAATGAAQSRSL